MKLRRKDFVMAKQEVRQALANLGYKSASVEIATVAYH